MIRILAFFASLLVGMAAAQAQSEPTVVNIGDVIQLVLPGEEAFDKPLRVERDGTVVVPQIGPVAVAGLAPGDARKRLRQALSRVYRDLDQFDVRVKERRLSVSVLGYVRNPGPVDIPGDGDVQLAIAAAGGLLPGAQLDRLQLRRAGRSQVFDYKKYLDTGTRTHLPALQSLDAIFVPASPLTGNVQIEFDARTLAATGDAADERNAVRVFGEVHQPGSFAFKEGMTAVDLLLRAGGVTRYAGVEQIRVIQGNTPRLFNLKKYLDQGDRSLLAPVGPGTTIFVPKESEEIRTGARVVYVMGEVFKPGAYESKPEATFLDILANAGGPTRYADSRQVRILRANGQVEPFDLTAYTEGQKRRAMPKVAPGDAIFVPEKPDASQQSWLKTPTDRAVRVLGAVRSPGRFEWSDEMSILDLVAQAGGPTDRADLVRVQILLPSANQAKPVLWNMERFLKQGGDLSSLPRLKGGATLTIPERPADPTDMKSEWIKQPSNRSIYVMGQVGRPGRYAFDPAMNFLDILSAADGPTANADLHNIRVSHRGSTNARVSKLNLALYLETGDDTILPRVVPGDVIFIPEKNRNWLDESADDTVRVLGSVSKPGRYRFSDAMTILDLLAEAGGPTRDAYQEKILVVNLADGSDQARSFDLVAFARSGDFSKLPVVRPGDTIYVPNISQSNWKIFMESVRDVVSILSIFALIGAL